MFKEDIMSSLPYVETVTDETFDVTDVMMDDGRLLLLKVSFGDAGCLTGSVLKFLLVREDLLDGLIKWKSS